LIEAGHGLPAPLNATRYGEEEMEIGEYPGRPYRIDPKKRTPRQSALIDRIEAGPRGRVPINLEIWQHNIEFAEVAEKFGEYVSQKAPFSPRTKEIVILVAASFWQSEFECYFHADLARKHGVSDAQIQAIWNKADPKFPDPVDQITYELVFAIYEKRDVSDDLHERAMEKLGHAGVSDIIGLTGLYSMIAQTIIFYRLSPPGQ
jgi:4-carboxymuconolactone decarboxylase